MTITAHSKTRGVESSLHNLRKHMPALLQRMRRKYGKFHYVRVYEPHKDGSLHIHMLVNFHFSDIQERKGKKGKKTLYSVWLAKAAADVKLGYITHAENMRSVAGAARYITKYMTKFDGKLPGNLRRIQCSLGFPKLPGGDLVWERIDRVYENDLDSAIENGLEIFDIQTDHTLTYDDFIDGATYPPESENIDNM